MRKPSEQFFTVVESMDEKNGHTEVVVRVAHTDSLPKPADSLGRKFVEVRARYRALDAVGAAQTVGKTVARSISTKQIKDVTSIESLRKDRIGETAVDYIYTVHVTN